MGDDGIGRLCAVVEHGPRTRPEFAHAARDGLVPDLDTPVAVLLGSDAPQLDGQTLRHLLTMTRGCETGGAWDLDAVEALPTGWVERACRAPRRAEPGHRSRYAAHPHLTADGPAALGALRLHGGRWGGTQLLDERFAAEMVAPHTAGGAPEHRGYGYLTWVDEHGPSAGGWAGQHVVVVPAAGAVIVTTGDPRFRFGPPHTDELADGRRPARDPVAEVLLPALRP